MSLGWVGLNRVHFVCEGSGSSKQVECYGNLFSRIFYGLYSSFVYYLSKLLFDFDRSVVPNDFPKLDLMIRIIVDFCRSHYIRRPVHNYPVSKSNIRSKFTRFYLVESA